MFEQFGHLSQHMALHIVLMNFLVPLGIGAARGTFDFPIWRSWPLATAVQLLLLWGWHAPPVLAAAMHAPALMILMHVSLVLAAAWFWAAVFSVPQEGGWRAIFALLISGKLFCLLGILLVFAPRQVYAGMTHTALDIEAALADQHLAGLIMVVACPLSYVLAGVVIAARWFMALEARA
ncbi:cytochrome c oxidase assembly protein [Pelagibacterium xiamenense]|uniref:cytochrome c oxidase assembly protein n=1 Tax=Pelagibacterium xiamenense TaxID=2901140 RepID=UPI001E615475|nr:cytochrome c oxidase assembly protein [Pelagibacterium xiamenense]MCD7058664.1 cytochrome c oxidase assembly protein [Pelagibacterium xiamenense]